jgi:large subunit ribosomal protein L10
MALTRVQKEDQLKDLKEKFKKANSVIFTQYIGMPVSEVTQFRKTLKASGAEMKVGKKTLMALAAKELDLPELPEAMMNGAIACIFSFIDPVSGAQVASKFAKDHPQVVFMGGLFEGKILSAAEAKSLASIPSREVLLATFAGMLQSPLRSFASMLNSPLSSFARATNELAKKKAN